MWISVADVYVHSDCLDNLEDEYLDEMIALGYFDLIDSVPLGCVCFVCGLNEEN